MTGLRGRLVALLALVCAVTLGVCALTLLPPLEQRLRNDQIAEMIREARQEAPTLGRIAGFPPRRSRQLTRAARLLRRRGGADVALIAVDGKVLAVTDPDAPVVVPVALRALRTGHTLRSTTGSGKEAESRVVVPTKGGFAIALHEPVGSARGAVGVVGRAFLVAVVVSLVIALLLGTLLAGRVVRRLRSLRDTALKVAELGPAAEFQSDNARDEVGDLTRAFAVMQEHLREQESARRAFVATASHELRTPLTSLRLMLDALREHLDGDKPDLAAARKQVGVAEAQADRLSTLTGDLLDLNRLDAGVPLRSELVEVAELARSVVAELVVRATEAGREIGLSAPEPLWAVADPGSAAQVLRILLDNALRHGGGTVDVDVAQHGAVVTIGVQDEGAGVPAADRERVFDRFERGDSGQPGFGLGLAIGRELAELMDGSLSLDSEPAHGARFVLSLPGAPAP
jgi:signal transduction histidine kinase